MSSEVNPFSSPRTEIRADQVDTFNVDGDRLLVPAHGDWPDICIDCGCATDQRVTVRLGHRPGDPGKTVQLPICADHRTSRQRGLRVTTACVIGFLVAIPVVLLMPSGSINAILVLSCILGFLGASAIYVKRLRHGLLIVEHHSDHVVVSGAKKPFLLALTTRSSG